MANQRTTTIHLEAGTHWMCTCGQSQNWPFCDGGHKGTSFQPLALALEAAEDVEVSE